jgi:hypothetical protein
MPTEPGPRPILRAGTRECQPGRYSAIRTALAKGDSASRAIDFSPSRKFRLPRIDKRKLDAGIRARLLGHIDLDVQT